MNFFIDLFDSACVSACNASRNEVLTLTGHCEVQGATGSECDSFGTGQVLNSAGTGCICDSANDFFLTSNGEDCTNACPPGEARNLEGTQCQDGCPGANQVRDSTGPGDVCECAMGFLLNLAGNACIDSCPSGELQNLPQTQCVSGCGANEIDNATHCICQAGSGSIRIAADRSQCFDGCPTPTLIEDIDRETCVDPIGGCTGSSMPNLPNAGACGCPGEFINYAMDDCTSGGCPLGQTNLFTGDTCGCNSFGLDPAVNQGFISSDGLSCSNLCGANEFINLFRTACVTSCNGLNEVEGMALGAAACVCSSGNFLASTGVSCVDSCDTNEVIDITGSMCISTAQCAAPMFADANADGQCECATGFVLSIDGLTCVVPCPTGEVLNLEGTACVADSCSFTNQAVNTAGDQCVCDTGFILNSMRTACVADCTPDEFLNIAGTACVAACDEAFQIENPATPNECTCSTGIMNLAGDACTDDCSATGHFLNIEGTQCISNCDAFPNVAPGDGICVCEPDAFININAGGLQECLAMCSDGTNGNDFVEVDGRNCVSVCPPNAVPFNNGTQTFCQCSNPLFPLGLDGVTCADRTSAVDCPTVSLDFSTCLNGCSGTDQIRVTDTVNGYDQCECVPGMLAQGDTCVSTCTAPDFLTNVDGRTCTNTCPSLGGVVSGTTICSCDPNVLDFGGRSCSMPDCGGAGTINLAGTQCIPDADCTGAGGTINGDNCECGSGTFLNDAMDACVSNDIAGCLSIGQFFDSVTGGCVEVCPNKLNLAGNECIAACPADEDDIDMDGQCACNPGLFADITLASCVNPCPGGQAVNLPGTACVMTANCGANTAVEIVGGIDVCGCTSGFFLNSASTACVNMCNTTIGEVLNLAGTQCIASCPSDSTADMNNQCVCDSPMFLNTDASACVSNCDPDFLNIGRTQCIDGCLVGEVTDNINFQCNCDEASGFHLNLDGDVCVNDCASGEVRNLEATQCVSMCGTNETANANDECECTSGFVLAADGMSCIAGADCPFALNIEGTQCVGACGGLEVVDNVAGADQCVCQSNALLNIMDNGCVSACGAFPERQDLDGRACETSCGGNQQINAGNTQCVCTPGFFIVPGNPSQCLSCDAAAGMHIDVSGTLCVNGCPANQSLDMGANRCECATNFVLSVDGLSCVTPCPTGEILNSAGDQCLNNCPGNEMENLSGDQCTGACGTNEDSVGGACVCDAANNALLNLMGTACVTTCASGEVRNLLETQCSQNCGTNEVDNSGQCECSSASVLNPTSDGCTLLPCSASSLFLSLAGDQCLSGCPAGVNQVANANDECVCDTGFALDLFGDACVIDTCQNINGGMNGVLNLAGTQCLSACPSLQVDVSNQCACDSGSSAILNIAGDSCVTMCGTNENAGATQCECVSGGFLNVAGDACVLDCAPNLVNENMDQCVVDCSMETTGLTNLVGDACVSGCGTGETIPSGTSQCACDIMNGFFPNAGGDLCVQTCGMNEVLNIAGTACVSNCILEGPNILNIAGTQCVNDCSGETPANILNFDSSQCLATCPALQEVDNGQCGCVAGTSFINLAGDDCIADCATDTTPAVINIAGTTCVLNCMNEGTDILNLLGTQCVSDCVMSQEVEVADQCTCNAGNNFFINSAGDMCVDGCDSISEVLNVAGDACVANCGSNILNYAGTQCVTACLTPSQTEDNGQCVCAMDFQDIGTGCVMITCQSDEVLIGGTCTPCDASARCATCEGTTTNCTSCNEDGFGIVNGNCVACDPTANCATCIIRNGITFCRTCITGTANAFLRCPMP